jgi:proteic killer suppression protein
MWHIREHRGIPKQCSKAPSKVVKKYELWKNIVFRHGPDKLKEFPGFHDEKLKGERRGQRSSRLSLQYRVVYTLEKKTVSVFVLEITPHENIRRTT